MEGKVIVIGASAGGVQALMQLVAHLPPALPAAILVVVHVSTGGRSQLAAILNKSGPLPAAHAQDGEALKPGRIYVAPPDRHLLVKDSVLQLSRGPRENHTRPAIDPLFRTAAQAYGSQVMGVILSGTLDDGSRGLAMIKAQGGVALVQDPQEAMFGSMPRAALARCPVDDILPVKELAGKLTDLARSSAAKRGDSGMRSEKTAIEQTIADDLQAQERSEPRSGQGSAYSCPECGGVLWQAQEQEAEHFRCHTGHTYSPRILLLQKSQGLEAMLWAAVRLLTEKATLTRQIKGELKGEGDADELERIEAMAVLDEKHQQILLEMLHTHPNPTGQDIIIEEAIEQAHKQAGAQREAG